MLWLSHGFTPMHFWLAPDPHLDSHLHIIAGYNSLAFATLQIMILKQVVGGFG